MSQTKMLMPGKQCEHLLCLLCSCCYRRVTVFDGEVVCLNSFTLGVFLEKSHADYTGCAGGAFWEHTPARR